MNPPYQHPLGAWLTQFYRSYYVLSEPVLEFDTRTPLVKHLEMPDSRAF